MFFQCERMFVVSTLTTANNTCPHSFANHLPPFVVVPLNCLGECPPCKCIHHTPPNCPPPHPKKMQVRDKEMLLKSWIMNHLSHNIPRKGLTQILTAGGLSYDLRGSYILIGPAMSFFLELDVAREGSRTSSCGQLLLLSYGHLPWKLPSQVTKIHHCSIIALHYKNLPWI